MRTLFTSLVSCWALTIFSTVALAQTKPNLIAIVTDDQGQWACGAYGNSEIRTPHMDRIGREGALFTNAFTATPVCSPSRATYLSGLWPTEVGITDFLAVMEAEAGMGLKASTWPQVLQKNGYTTGLIGKWHLGTHPQYHPQKLGFDHFMGFLGGGNSPMNPTLEVDGKDQKLKGTLPDLLVDDAIRFVEANREQPFALCLHFRAPHLPYGPVPEVDSEPYEKLTPSVVVENGADEKQVQQWNREYYASVSSVDRNIGRLLETLDKLGLEKNTLVMFTSDHGYNNGRHNVDTKGNANWIAGGVRGPKRPNMWDSSIRVPLLVRWPAVLKAGSKIDYPVMNIDMFRTVLGALQVPLPADAKPHGLDYSPLLRGQPMPDRPAIFGQYDLHNAGLAYMRMIRTPQYKYVRHYKCNYMDELYDLTTDPDEKHNILGNRQPHPAVENLKAQLVKWQESIADPVLKSDY